MKEQLNKLLAAAKEFWARQSVKQKKLLGFGAGGILFFVIAITVFLNVSSNGYKVLYPGLSSQETAEVYATLQEMSVTPQVNSKGEVMVPKDQWDSLLVELAGKGFPQSVPAYGMFLDNASMTSTEYEKKKVYVFSLQDRLQESLKRLSGVKDAVVTINIPEESGYVWDKTSEEASAGIVITMNPGSKLSPEKVSAIKNLVAYSLPGMMQPENVKVVDAATGLEIEAQDDAPKDGVDYQRLEYERTIQKSIEDDIKRLLAPRYGADGVTAVAKVTLNYDKVVTESREVVPQGDGKGVPTHFDESYSVDGNVPATGIVGEENNTDLNEVPQYQNQSQNGTGDTTDYNRSIDYDIGYILKQVENGQGILTQASVAVVVNEPDLSPERESMLIDLISKAVSIEPAYIRVSNLDFTSKEKPVSVTGMEALLKDPMLPLMAGGLIVLILLLLLVMILLKRRSKRKKAEKDMAQAIEDGMYPLGQTVKVDSEHDLAALQQEIDEHKRMIQKNAEISSKEDAMVNEIRSFAKENPEITASIIRSMLKEEE